MIKEFIITVPFLVFLLTSALGTCDVNNFCRINENENITYKVWNETGRSYLTTFDSYIDIFKGSVQIIDNATLTLAGDTAYFTLSGNTTDTEGIYIYYITSFYGDSSSHESGTYEITDHLNKDYFEYWNETLFIAWDSMLDTVYDNIITPASDLVFNIYSYLDGRLETTVSSEDKLEIAQNTWNDTVTAWEDRKIDTRKVYIGEKRKLVWNIP